MSIGLSIHTCPVEVREKMAVPEDKWEEAVKQLTSYPHVEEAGILSTCNRMEIYVVALSWHRGVREVEEWMSQYSGIPLDELREHLFLLRDQDATSHLLKVSGGLDSVVMGEGQILAQVKNVFALGENVKQSNWGDYQTVRFPQTRMGVEQVYYDHFHRAREYGEEWDAYRAAVKATPRRLIRQGKGPKAPRRDLALRG